MTLRTPIIRIIGPSGFNIIDKLGPAFLGATITDQEGYESDQLVIRVAARPPFSDPPPSRHALPGAGRLGALTTAPDRHL
jgi:phage protein D